MKCERAYLERLSRLSATWSGAGTGTGSSPAAVLAPDVTPVAVVTVVDCVVVDSAPAAPVVDCMVVVDSWASVAAMHMQAAKMIV